MDMGEMVQIYTDLFRDAVAERGFTLREVIHLMHSYMLNSSYLSHRLKKGSVPVNVFRAACEVIGVDFRDYCVEYDLSEVPTYQLEAEFKERRG